MAVVEGPWTVVQQGSVGEGEEAKRREVWAQMGPLHTTTQGNLLSVLVSLNLSKTAAATQAVSQLLKEILQALMNALLAYKLKAV